MKRICISIGVSRAEALAELPGAITAAEEIAAWARGSGFDIVETLTDEEEATPVTVAALREALVRVLADDGQGIDALVLHFAGHGQRQGAEQNLWLPTNWKSELRAINVEGLRSRLSRHEIRNLSIFSDACRSQPGNAEFAGLTPDAVLGQGPYDIKLPKLDRFNAVADGRQAFMVSRRNGEHARCVFSTAVVEALCGHREEAFDKYITDKVTPQSLDVFLTSRLEEIGVKYGFVCAPENYPASPSDHLIYFDKAKPIIGAMPLAPIWPEYEAPVEETNYRINLEYMTDWRPGRLGRTPRRARPVRRSSKLQPEQKVEKRLRLIDAKFDISQHKPIGHANLAIKGGRVIEVWGTNIEIERLSEVDSRSDFRVDLGEASSASILIEFEDDIFASAIIYPYLNTVVARGDTGIVGWVCVDSWDDYPRQLDRSLDAIARLELGELTAGRADSLAANLRQEKHVNPILGALCSYLYEYSGDVDSVRRMAYFYANHRQDIPFDIAFMGLLNIRRRYSGSVTWVPAVDARENKKDNLPDWVSRATPEMDGKVAGEWPIFRQGWSLMVDPEPAEEHAAIRLAELSQHLLPSQFTSFTQIGGRMAIDMFKLTRGL